MNIRGTFKVTGLVQGVRYREAVLRLARDRGLVGFVKNRKDGSVRVVAEGEETTVGAFAEILRIRSGRIEVDDVAAEYSAPKGRFTRFRIIRGKNISDGELEILERLDSGLDLTEALARKQDDTVTAVRTMGGDIKSTDGHIQSMDGHIQSMDGHIQSMDGHIQSMDGHIQSMDGHITGMDRNIGAHLERLEGKQDATTEAVKAVSSDLKALDSNIRSMDQHVKTMDRNIGGHFDRLDQKYDSFGASLAQAASDIHDMKGDIHEVRSDIHDVKADIHEVAARRKEAPS